MKKSILRMTSFLLASSFLLPGFSFAAQDAGREARLALSKSLATNRTMLARAQAEYTALSREAGPSPSPEMERELARVRYKIQALNEENQKLTEALPQTVQASEFLKDMLAKNEPADEVPVTFARPAAKPQFAVEETPPATTEVPRQLFTSPQRAATPNDGPKDSVNPKTAQLHEQALKNVAKKDLLQAIRLYEEIVLIDPNDDEAYLILGHCLVLTGDYAKGERAFQSAVQIRQENVRQIVPFYQNLVAQNPNDPNAYANLGFILLMFGNLERAREAFEKALSFDPRNPDAAEGLDIIENESR